MDDAYSRAVLLLCLVGLHITFASQLAIREWQTGIGLIGILCGCDFMFWRHADFR